MVGRMRGWCWFWMVLLLAPAPAPAGMELNGVVSSENYLGLKKREFYNFRNANLFQLKVKAKPSEQVAGFADMELRNTNFTDVQTVGDLWDRGSVDPVSWRINEAYVDIYGFLLDGDALALDFRVGKQKIAWGEADGFNPTNNFDPYNLENPLDFKEHLGNVALKATFTIGEELLVLEGVVAPRFLPAVLPVDLFLGGDTFNNPLMPSIPPDMFQALEELDGDLVPPGMQTIRTIPPRWDVDNVMTGMRLKWAVLGFDWSVSYFHGRDTLPALKSAIGVLESSVAAGCLQEDRICLVITDVELVYPRIDVVGFDFRGGIGDVGFWGEVGLFLPEKLDGTITAQLWLVSQEYNLPVIDDEPFAKWTLGAEYTFRGGYFINLQWVHGFFTERTGHDLHDYLFLVFRKGFLSDRLKIELTLGGELNTSLHRRSLGGLGNITVSYKPYDGAEVAVGYLLARGDPGMSFKLFEPLDQVYLKLKAEF